MDDFYGFYNASSSFEVNIKNYFTDYAKLVEIAELKKCKPWKDDKSSVNFMSDFVNNEDFALLSDYCSVDHLTVPGELPKFKNRAAMKCKDMYKNDKDPEESCDLQTLKDFEDHVKGKRGVPCSLKYGRETIIHYDNGELEGPFAVPKQDILVSVRVYNPFTQRDIRNNTVKRLQKMSVDCVIEILGSQTLDKLRDKITCISDMSIPTEVSNNPQKPTRPMAKDVYKSGFFYIERTFYNDYRDPRNIDYSEVIRNWAEPRKLGPYKTASMEDVRVDSLVVRFGYPWVYQHQGSCEHLLVFSDARFVNCHDDLAISCYPRLQRIRPKSAVSCMMCALYAACWIITESDRLPHNPCYFCNLCFKSYNYIDGKKIGNFKAYAYPDDLNLTDDGT